MSALTLLSLVLAGAALGLMFIPRWPAAAVAYVAMFAGYMGATSERLVISGSNLFTWGCAAAIVLALSFVPGRRPRGSAHLYPTLGAIAGVAVGFVSAPTSAAMVMGSAIGTLLGALAFVRTPAGRGLSVLSRPFLDYACATGLPAVVAAVTIALTVVQGFNY